MLELQAFVGFTMLFLKKYSPSLDVCDGNLRVVWAVVKTKQQPVKNLQ